MKSERHEKILKIIKDNSVEKQEDLTELLRKAGFDVTQATVSRDIKELGLVKVAVGEKSKKYKYAVNGIGTDGNDTVTEKFRKILHDVLINSDYAGNLAVFKTYSGMANAAAAAIDAIHYHDIVGTVAGDDTVLVILRNEQAAGEFVELLQKVQK